MLLLSRRTHAKINLALHVIGKRDDGYHLLESIVAFADIGDTLTVTVADTISLEITGLFAAGLGSKNNLVMKAAEMLAAHENISHGAHFTLEKNLPIASGIGGGSGDAAAALMLLNEHWQLNLPPEILKKMALKLGADVPVCLESRASFMRGIGENIKPIKLPKWYIVLINPMAALSTADIFQAYSDSQPTYNGPLEKFPEKAEEWISFLAGCGNVLQEAATQKLPVISTIIAAISKTPGCKLARMSGSGATCFGIYETEKEAFRASQELAEKYPGFWTRQGRIR